MSLLRAADRPGPKLIDVQVLIRTLSDEQLLRSADAYFEKLTLDSEQCRKPFSNPRDAPRLAQHLGLLLDAADLFQGCTVLDFGCATGWMTIGLADMGCDAIGVDIAPSALRLAEETLHARSRTPRGSARFMAYDGHKLPLDDESVDRIVCFDAFHHVRDQEATIREFARVLRAGGRIAMLEPGPHHSTTPQSQEEMRQFSVIENDIKIADIAAHAAACRLDAPEMLLQLQRPMTLALDEFMRWGTSGPSPANLKELGRKIQRELFDLQCFFISKGNARPDSRDARGLAAQLTLASLKFDSPAPGSCEIDIRARNSGESLWRGGNGAEAGTVKLGLQLWSPQGPPFNLDFMRIPLPGATVAPGEEVSWHVVLDTAHLAGSVLKVDMVSEHVAWFSQLGRCPVLIIPSA